MINLKPLKNKSNNKGFTLIETIVVVFVIGLMVSVVVPVFFKSEKDDSTQQSIINLLNQTKLQAMKANNIDVAKDFNVNSLYKGISIKNNTLYAVEWDNKNSKWKKITSISPVDISDIYLTIKIQGQKVNNLENNNKPLLVFKNNYSPNVIFYNNGNPYVRLNSMGVISYE